MNCALIYLEAIQKTLSRPWLESYSTAQDVYIKLALLHPEHYKSLDLPSNVSISKLQAKIQGPRSFQNKSNQGSCNCNLLWGYNCTLNEDIQQDHLFPYSLGGPTLGTNRIYLCRYHNMVKTSDIHIYPWINVTTLTQQWLDNQIKMLHSSVFSIYNQI